MLFTVSAGPGDWQQAEVVVESLDTGRRLVVVEGGNAARYLSTGHVVYVQGGTLFALPFDAESLETSGAPVPVVEGIAQNATLGTGHFGVSAAGAIAYVPGTLSGVSSRLVYVDREGREELLSEESRNFDGPRLSPDEQRVAVTVRGNNIDIWVYDLERGSMSRLTFDPGEDESPLWTPDGEYITFASDRDGSRLTLQRPADGSGDEQVVMAGEPRHHHLGAWSTSRDATRPRSPQIPTSAASSPP